MKLLRDGELFYIIEIFKVGAKNPIVIVEIFI